MAESEQCPSCSSAVGRDEDRCPSCGSVLEPTLAEERTVGPPGEGDPGLQFRPGSIFAERYTIIESIGWGGMGVVYKAIDRVLKCEIALKLILPELARNPAYLERFKREVRITRQITHPNICRVHDIGSSEDLLFLSMEWIEGETLQQLLRKAGMLKESRALAIAESIARALEAAHDKGMVHRDLKPANIMLDRRGNVYVLDFGLALEQGSEQLSRIGAKIGTPLYMSPEQKEGQKVDARTDLYALGLILCEMLTGRRPQMEDSSEESLSTGINSLIRPLIKRLLASREERCSSASELRRDIQQMLLDPAISTSSAMGVSAEGKRRLFRRKGLGIGIAAAVVAAAAFAAYLYFPRSAIDRMDPKAEAFYARGYHYLRDIEEKGESSTLDDAIQMFHRALDHEPDSALVLASLGEAYWLRFEEKRLLSSREEAERAVRRAYEIDPDLAEVRNARGLGFLIEGKYEAARSELELAVDAKPELCIAWTNLGEVHQHLGNYAEGIKALNKAIKLEPGNANLPIHLGLFHLHFGEKDEAFDCFERATELEGGFHAWNDLGAAYLYTGRYDFAIPAIERALAIREDAAAVSNLGTALYSLGRYEEAIARYRRATELEPGQAVHWGNLGDTLLVSGDAQGAREAYAQAAEAARARLDLEPIKADALSVVALYCAKAQDSECALKQAAAAHEMQPDNHKIMLRNAVVNCILGRDADGLEWLDRAVRHGASRAEIELRPEFERLREDHRYTRILELAS